MNVNYVSGRNLEYEVCKLFKNAGWQVSRSAGSHSPWDLTAVKFTGKKRKRVEMIVLAQCKQEARVPRKRRPARFSPTGVPK